MTVRVVRAEDIDGANVRVPCAARMPEARGLVSRFAAAKLRPVTMLRAADLDLRADPSGETRVWLALECLQVTGSFKVRGALFAVAAHLAAGRSRVVSVSAGNHGAGLAYAAKVLGMDATICVPRTAAKNKVAKIEAQGAKLVLVDTASYDDAEIFAKALAEREGLPFLSPYDDEDIVLGNGSSLGFEIAERFEGAAPRVIVPLGGGGLATGVGWALASLGRAHARLGPGERHVWGTQSEASCAMATSLETGVAVEHLPVIAGGAPTFAEGLEGGISIAAFERARHAVAGVLVVSEVAIARAMTHAFKELGLVIEGSAAVALVPLLTGLPEALRGGDVVSLLTGRNVDADRLLSAMAC
jgi:threonine dehydratase